MQVERSRVIGVWEIAAILWEVLWKFFHNVVCWWPVVVEICRENENERLFLAFISLIFSYILW